MARRAWTKTEALEDTRCKTILAAVERVPGIGMSDARDRSSLGWNAFYDALSKLKQAGLVRVDKGQPTRIYPAHIEAAPRVLSRRAEKIARAIAGGAGTVSAVCAAAQLAPSSVYHELSRLIAGGFVTFSRAKPYEGLRATPRLEELFRKP